MALRLSLYLPKESINNIDSLIDFVTEIGNFVSKEFGNEIPVDEFNLENLNSLIIISDEELPNAENFEDRDMFLVIPIQEEN